MMTNAESMLNFIYNHPVRFGTSVVTTTLLINSALAVMGNDVTKCTIAAGMLVGSTLSFFSHVNQRQAETVFDHSLANQNSEANWHNHSNAI